MFTGVADSCIEAMVLALGGRHVKRLCEPNGCLQANARDRGPGLSQRRGGARSLTQWRGAMAKFPPSLLVRADEVIESPPPFATH
jgi:hypothetical protein